MIAQKFTKNQKISTRHTPENLRPSAINLTDQADPTDLKEKKGLPELETGNPDLKRVVSKLPRRTHRAFQHPVRLIVAREHLFYGIPLE